MTFLICFRDHYSKRFPELDSLVPTPLEYIRTIKELGNDLEKYKNNEVLQEVFLIYIQIFKTNFAALT